MSTKVITDPSALGWEQDGATPNGTPLYQWSGGQDMGPIKNGDTEGQVTTWSDSAQEWTPDSSLTIDSTGNATFSGTVNADELKVTDTRIAKAGIFHKTGRCGISLQPDSILPTDGGGTILPNAVDIGGSTQKFKDAFFSGTVDAGGFTVNGSPLTRVSDLIETLSTLRQATMDETQDIRESLRSAIDELVEGFEQQISTMPAPEEEQDG